MKTGICPKCSAREVYAVTSSDSIPARSIRPATLSQFVCASCGFVERYVQDAELLPKIKQAAQKISAENVLNLEDPIR